MECILLFLITASLEILEELILCRDLVMMFKMINHLAKVMWESFKVDLARDGAPSKVVMWLLIVYHFCPEIGAGFLHDALNKLCIISIQDLVLKHSAALSLWQVLVCEPTGRDRRSNWQLWHTLHYQLILHNDLVVIVDYWSRLRRNFNRFDPCRWIKRASQSSPIIQNCRLLYWFGESRRNETRMALCCGHNVRSRARRRT